jgi:RimJ/RimL family protein N-acetyltransferase
MIDFNYGVTLGALESDAKELYLKWRNDYTVWKWCRQYDLIDDQSHAAWFERQSRDSKIAMYHIVTDDFIVGVCGLTDIDRVNQRAEFSLYIAPEHQRKGYAKAALKTLLAHGFLNHNLNLIWGETFEGNKAYDMFLALGMQYDGTRREFYYRGGRFIDASLVSITRKDFLEASWSDGLLQV